MKTFLGPRLEKRMDLGRSDHILEDRTGLKIPIDETSFVLFLFLFYFLGL